MAARTYLNLWSRLAKNKWCLRRQRVEQWSLKMKLGLERWRLKLEKSEFGRNDVVLTLKSKERDQEGVSVQLTGVVPLTGS